MKTLNKDNWLGKIALLLIGVSLVTSCANLNTISRSTSLESNNKNGKAIHLDIQQRLLIVNAMGQYCSEPSPDALAAFAAAAGIGASSPAKGSASATASSSSSAASIGLRTQSITLMRDALYRMCEAYGNGQLSGPQVMALLSRSQDLTAVILATEQLTGVVVAQQAALSGNAVSDATSIMTATSKLIELALNQQERAQARFEQAVERKSDAEGKLKASQDEMVAAQADTQSNPGDDAAGRRAIARLKKAELAHSATEREVTLAEKIRILRENTLEAATARVDAFHAAVDSAATTAAASSSSSASLSGGATSGRLNDQSTQAIANAVASMVNNVLNKPYVLDYCMAIITGNNNGRITESTEHTSKTTESGLIDIDLCKEVIISSTKTEKIRVTATSEVFDDGDTKNTNCIESWLNTAPENMDNLSSWRNKQIRKLDHLTFMYSRSARNMRADLIDELSISCE